MRYSGRPPIDHEYIATLQEQIQEEHTELKRGIDADWRASILRYPAVLDYFFSLVELRLPSETAPEMKYIDRSPLVSADTFTFKPPPFTSGVNPEAQPSAAVVKTLDDASHADDTEDSRSETVREEIIDP
jgi:hypothetical protein